MLHMKAELQLVLAFDLGGVVLDQAVVGYQPEWRLAAERIRAQIQVADARPIERSKRIRQAKRGSIVGVKVARAASVVVSRTFTSSSLVSDGENVCSQVSAPVMFGQWRLDVPTARG